MAHSREQDRETLRIARGLGLFVLLTVVVLGVGYVVEVATGLPLTSDVFGRISMLGCALGVVALLWRRGGRARRTTRARNRVAHDSRPDD